MQEENKLLELRGRTTTKTIEPRVGLSLLELAMAANIDFGFSCTRGTCARCRALIIEGREHLKPATDAEIDRLGEDEIEEGYRLACQAVIKEIGTIRARNKTYF